MRIMRSNNEKATVMAALGTAVAIAVTILVTVLLGILLVKGIQWAWNL